MVKRDEKQPDHATSLLDRTKEWTIGVWVVIMIAFISLCGMGTLIILFILTLMFGDVGAT